MELCISVPSCHCWKLIIFFYLYTVVAGGCVLLQCSGVVKCITCLEVKNMPTCILYTVCSGNGSSALMKYWQQYTLCRIIHCKTLETAQKPEGDWFHPTSECRMWMTTEWRRWLSGTSAVRPNYKCMQNLD